MPSNEVVNVSSNPSETYSVTCWACNLELILPYYSPVFKCGYCGAISQGAGSHAFDYLESRGGKNNDRYLATRDRIIVIFVILLICFIIVGGVWAVFPVLFVETNFSFIVHSVLTCVLSFNVFFNYSCATFRHAGKPKNFTWGSSDLVKPNSLDNVGFCDKCRKPKPAGAHHCRACRECIMDMDHHCPFIGNCVGGNNQRHFMIFLVYTILSCLYVLVMSISAVIKLWPAATASLFDGNGRYEIFLATTTNLFLLGKLFSKLKLSFSMRMVIIGYLILVSLTTMISVAVLLYQQIKLVLEGQTYIESIQLSQNRSTGWGREKNTMGRLRSVFGLGSPLLWLLPLWGHPPGSRASTLFTRKHRMRDL